MLTLFVAPRAAAAEEQEKAEEPHALSLSAGLVDSVVDVSTRGLMYHIPFALGLALGERHQFELAFSYLFHPEQEQYGGALALGFMFPLDLD